MILGKKSGSIEGDVSFKRKISVCILLAVLGVHTLSAQPDEVPLYSIHELVFEGETYTVKDEPVVDVEFYTIWRHEDGHPHLKIYGFFDGNGTGGPEGNVFKVRFTPTNEGEWELIETFSNDEKLNGQLKGTKIICTASSEEGFWLPDPNSAGQRWYMQSNGSHRYIVGNTMYSFLSETMDGKPTGGNIKDDVVNNAQYFDKLRFAITGDIYPHPTENPFLDNQGNPTDDGNFAHKPNPKWFYERVDLAVQTAYEHNLIADMILNGPDSKDARSALFAGENGGDNTPFLRYMAARYGSYPNVWFCLSNEYDIRNPKFSPEFIKSTGYKMMEFMPYNNPLSVHGNQGNWIAALNGLVDWNDHVIIQNKLKSVNSAADYLVLNYHIGEGNKPVFNDELAYEGGGDLWNELEVLEGFLGTFLGGGYGSGGHKPASKKGHYFAGNFSAEAHKSADNLKWFSDVVTENVAFWNLQPAFHTHVAYGEIKGPNAGIFKNLDEDFRALEWKDNQYVLGTNKARKNIGIALPDGNWLIKYYDIINKKEVVLSEKATGTFIFDSPESEAVLVHVKKIN